jgi:hypothetical protein
MTPEEKMWRDRFIAINLVRIGGTIIVLFGLYISQLDAGRPGSAMIAGLGLAILGLVAAFGGPKWLARKWRTPPNP